MNEGYQPRIYRNAATAPDLQAWQTVLGESDLHVQAEQRLTVQTLEAIREARGQIQREIARRPEFLTSLVPLIAPDDAPPLVAGMYAAGAVVNVGPMAAVAGAVAQWVGEALLEHSAQVLVENGGDLFLATIPERIVSIWAGASPLSGRVGLVVPAGWRGGVCTSSGTVGHSYSAGRADAAVIVAADAALADAAASGLGNRVRRPDDAEDAVQWALTVPGVTGAAVIIGAQLAAGGELELRPLG
ncbi:MAG TPA: UPF0280 family protein [Armatimonadota bacterium]|jgi:hypothetical protein